VYVCAAREMHAPRGACVIANCVACRFVDRTRIVFASMLPVWPGIALSWDECVDGKVAVLEMSSPGNQSVGAG
jgi:hypothetical protein